MNTYQIYILMILQEKKKLSSSNMQTQIISTHPLINLDSDQINL